MGDDDRELMLDQVMKGGTPNDVDDRFFTEAVGREEAEGNSNTPEKSHVKREPDASPEKTETPEEQKRKQRLQSYPVGPLCAVSEPVCLTSLWKV